MIKSGKFRTVEVKPRSEIQEHRMDEAYQRVQDGLIKRGKPYSSRLSAEMEGKTRLKVKEIAKEAGFTDRTVIHWMEYGSRDISRLGSLCKALDVDANYLLGLIDERKTLSEIKLNTFDDFIVNNYPTCGCTEMLCGHGGVGCTRAKDEEE